MTDEPPIDESADEPVALSATDPTDAEKAVLGALMNDEAAWDKIGDLKIGDFTDVSRRMIFEAIQKLERAGTPPDLIAVSDELRRHENFHEHPEILEYAGYLQREHFTSSRITHYVGIVRNCSLQRHLRHACNDIIGLIGDPKGRNAHEILDEAERLVHEVSDKEKQGGKDFKHIGEAAAHSSDAIQERYEWAREHPGKQFLLGTPTGFSDFDSRTSGLQPGELIILAASPSMGKTSLAMNIAFNVAMGGIPGYEEGGVVAVFSMEMSAQQLADRMLSMVAEVDQNKLRTGQLKDANWKSIETALGLLSRPKLYIYETPAATPTLIRRMARRLKASQKGKLGLIVLDYLQLIPSEERQSNSNRNAELSVITRNLKAIANELQTPVLCLSQLNRQGSGREAGEVPKLQELRDSGAIEQDADVVMFLYKSDGEEDINAPTISTELQIAKNRNGPCFKMGLMFTKRFFHFKQRSPEEDPDQSYPTSDYAS